MEDKKKWTFRLPALPLKEHSPSTISTSRWWQQKGARLVFASCPLHFFPWMRAKELKTFRSFGNNPSPFPFSFFFPVPNKFVQVRSILTLQIHSAHIPAQSLKQSEKGNGAEEFWVTPAVMRSPLSWQWKKSVNIYRAWSLQWCEPVLLNSSCLQPVSVYTGRVQLWGNAIFLICGEACNAVFILATKGIVCFCNTWLYPTLRII